MTRSSMPLAATLLALPVHAHAAGDCGNGQFDVGESCEDGGDVGGDGCSPTCQIEAGWGCQEASFDLIADEDLTPGFHGVTAAWTLSPDRDSVFQSPNADPSIYISALAPAGLGPVVFDVGVETASDDDFIGFVVGFDAGEFTATDAVYLLFDWKQGTQNIASLGSAQAGLAMSVVRGGTTTSDLWGHTGTVTEVARAATLGATGWGDNVSHRVTLDVTAGGLRVDVDGVTQFDATASDLGLTTVPAGTLGFYVFSQPSVRSTLVSPLTGTSACFQLDTDGDGVFDLDDACEGGDDGLDDDSDGVPDDCDDCDGTTLTDPAGDDGCSVPDQCACDDPWVDAAAYVTCVTGAADGLVADGAFTVQERDDAVADAQASGCGAVGGDSGDSAGDSGNSGDSAGDSGDSTGDSGDSGDSAGDSGNSGDSAGDSGNSGDSAGDSGDSGDSAGDSGDTVAPVDDTADPADTADGETGGGSALDDTDADPDLVDRSCGCASPGSTPFPLLLILAAAAGHRRRRRVEAD